MNRGGLLSKRRATTLANPIPLILNMTRTRSPWLNGSRATRSRSCVVWEEGTREVWFDIIKLTKSLIYCYQKIKSNYSLILKFHQLMSSRTWGIANGTMQHLIILMIAKFFDSRSRWLSSKGGSNLKFQQGQWRLMVICFLLTWLMLVEKGMHYRQNCWHHNRLKSLVL